MVPESANEMEEAEPRSGPEFTRSSVGAHITSRIRFRRWVRELGVPTVVARGSRPPGPSSGDRSVAPHVTTGGVRSRRRRPAAARGQRSAQLSSGGSSSGRLSEWPPTERSLRCPRRSLPLCSHSDGPPAGWWLPNHRMERRTHQSARLQHATTTATTEAGVRERTVRLRHVVRGPRGPECARAAAEDASRTEEPVPRGAGRVRVGGLAVAARPDSSRMCQLIVGESHAVQY